MEKLSPPFFSFQTLYLKLDYVRLCMYVCVVFFFLG